VSVRNFLTYNQYFNLNLTAMRKPTFQAMLLSTVTAVDFSAIEAETEATYGMVLPGSIPSPIAAQTTAIEVLNGNGTDYRGV
jgi:hypothetical protein